MRRSAVSISSKITEGFSRHSANEKIHFYAIAKGSLTELQNQILIARDLLYFNIETAEALLDQSTTSLKLIHGLVKSAQTRNTI
ncbi:MAG: four helix bundle protein [Candidatus Pacebacteria bacterium]|jgi:four helix bundle protein|nr:four helix bundle protein [Candidatus Paceibacterota bacterium]